MTSDRVQAKPNVVLIGMPGVGKSTLGVLLARELAFDFVDTDLLIQCAAGRTLQHILDAEGYLALRAAEEKELLALTAEHCVIATGGSAVYSEKAMAALRSQGVIVFLDLPLDDLRARIDNYEERGIARRPDQTFEALFAERRGLYLQWAEIVIDCRAKSINQLVAEVEAKLNSEARLV